MSEKTTRASLWISMVGVEGTEARPGRVRAVDGDELVTCEREGGEPAMGDPALEVSSTVGAVGGETVEATGDPVEAAPSRACAAGGTVPAGAIGRADAPDERDSGRKAREICPHRLQRTSSPDSGTRSSSRRER